MRTARILLLIAIFLCLTPIASILAADYIATWYGCELDDAGPKPCMINGYEAGGLFHQMYNYGWLALTALPLLLILSAIWIIAELISALRRARRS